MALTPAHQVRRESAASYVIGIAIADASPKARVH